MSKDRLGDGLSEEQPVEIVDSVIDDEELEMARQVLSSVLKAVKSRKMYLSNNPMRARFLGECYRKMIDFLNRYGSLLLVVTDYQLVYKGCSIYENRNKLESFSFKLYVDGIINITFSKGLNNQEIDTFLSIVGTDIEQLKVDDDIGTMFWNASFHHIEYTQDDDFFDCEIDNIVPRKEIRQIDIQRIVASELDGFKKKSGYYNKISFVLDDGEIQKLKNELDENDKKDPVAVVIAILGAIIVSEEGDEFTGETLELLKQIQADLLAGLELEHAGSIIKLYHELLESGQMVGDTAREIITGALEDSGSHRQLMMLTEKLNATEEDMSEALSGMLEQLSEKSVAPLTEMICALDNMKCRRTVCDILIKKCRTNPDPLYKKLKDSRWYVLRNILYILARLGNADFVDKVGHLAVHGDIRVRKELLRLLESRKDEKSSELLLEMMNDSAISIRIAAIRQLSARKNRVAVDILMGLIEDKCFNEKDLSEQEEIVHALAVSEKEAVLPVVRLLLNKRKLFGLLPDVDVGLASSIVKVFSRINEKYAVDFIEELKASRSRGVREAVQVVLNGK